MIRALRSLVGRREGWSGSVDLTVGGTLADMSAESYSELGNALRNGLVARFVAAFTGISDTEVAGQLSRMMGLSMGANRMTPRVLAAWRPRDASLRRQLQTALDGEVLAGASRALEGIPRDVVRVLADSNGGVSPQLAGVVALRARRLRALGGRTIGQGIAASLDGNLDRLAPIAIIGPIRLQTDSLADALRSTKLRGSEWSLPMRDDEQSLRDRVALRLANDGFLPRFSGSF